MLKYESIVQALRQPIQSGVLSAGEQLPSIRNLSKQYACSRSTILKALGILQDQHLIYSIPKSGYYVVEDPKFRQQAPSETIDFATASPTWHAFPYLDFKHCINQAINTYQEELFQYGTLKGLPILVKEAKKLLESYQVFADREQIFITSGVQQALTMLSMMNYPNHHSTILVEQPSYHKYLDMLKTYQLPVIGIKRTIKGIDLNHLEQLFQQNSIKFFYTMPRFHNPLGNSYNKKEKQAIVQLAHQYDVYIVEDDYLADFEYNNKNDPLFTEDFHQRVIYLKSFSKIMFPGLRVGIAVLPKQLTQSFQLLKRATEIDSSMISQAALHVYLQSGMFERYKSKVSHAYFERAKRLQQSIQTHLSQYESSSEMVMHGHIRLPKQVNLRSFIQDMHEQHVRLDSIEQNYYQDFYNERLLKLNVSTVQVDRIDEGIRKIADALMKRKHIFV